MLCITSQLIDLEHEASIPHIFQSATIIYPQCHVLEDYNQNHIF